ncbi:FmdB family zinc ribbon protein [Candidatus Uabimicrobium sp. HlEnr_7]|uniref:FmdB family zinc ribbon protein n=1 Tax=Candidatus Uabimicrobium helgolandensis TaxID=3095367 RepID=UPI003558D76C
MPIYVYQAKETEKGCEYCTEEFEIMQSIKDEALTECPKCSAEIKKIIQPFGFSVGKKHMMTDKNLKKKGFTKLVNEGNGKFRKL